MAQGLAAPACRPDQSDRELLERFQQGEESAFTALVQRHGSQVQAVCRRVVRQEQDAEDVSQGAFLTLARKAGRVHWQASVGNWLCAVAYRLSLNARSASDYERVRLGAKHGDCYLSKADPFIAAAQQELHLVLDDELHRLPEKYRAPVVLCYLEGKSNQEAARQLGWPSGSMSRRLARARLMLRDRLTRRGVVLFLFLSLSLIGLVTLRCRIPSQDSDPSVVAQAMSQFKHQSEGDPAVEPALQLLAADDRLPPWFDGAQSLRVAGRTVAIADAIQDHDPGQQRQAWVAATAAMRHSALDLERASRQNDEPGILLAAARLNASCKQCHDAFRH
jgi:RNA polymerase sigma-70 factor (ECF subfamily)